jgi:hypothetical protein
LFDILKESEIKMSCFLPDVKGSFSTFLYNKDEATFYEANILIKEYVLTRNQVETD